MTAETPASRPKKAAAGEFHQPIGLKNPDSANESFATAGVAAAKNLLFRSFLDFPGL
ncbi:hypothetical protein [Afipia sp. Root123D2]|uniref:hypothetical protein n=1 Tax=Afipia sp. Root123D2 TaxID=1736436 RepID=UPI0012E896C8|nr:hypothetical protein [Afipia sp. Root123D2]